MIRQSIFIYLFLKDLIYSFTYLFEREKMGGPRGRGTSRFYAECGAQHGALSHDPKIMTGAETRSRTFH